MGAVEDLRKLLQDVVTPDLKALDARLTSLEKRLDGRIDTLDKRLDSQDKKIDSVKTDLERKIDASTARLEDKMRLNQDIVMAEIRHLAFQMNANFASIQHSLDIDRRLERIESGMANGEKAGLERTS